MGNTRRIDWLDAVQLIIVKLRVPQVRLPQLLQGLVGGASFQGQARPGQALPFRDREQQTCTALRECNFSPLHISDDLREDALLAALFSAGGHQANAYLFSRRRRAVFETKLSKNSNALRLLQALDAFGTLHPCFCLTIIRKHSLRQTQGLDVGGVPDLLPCHNTQMQWTFQGVCGLIAPYILSLHDRFHNSHGILGVP